MTFSEHSGPLATSRGRRGGFLSCASAAQDEALKDGYIQLVPEAKGGRICCRNYSPDNRWLCAFEMWLRLRSIWY
jgi:hypothetical protein